MLREHANPGLAVRPSRRKEPLCRGFRAHRRAGPPLRVQGVRARAQKRLDLDQALLARVARAQKRLDLDQALLARAERAMTEWDA